VNWHATNFHQPPIPPGGGTQGNSPVVNGLLAYFDTSALDPGFYFICMSVYPVQGSPPVCTTQFSLFKQGVRILSVDGAALDTCGPTPAPSSRRTSRASAKTRRAPGSAHPRPPRCPSVYGGAFVGGCPLRETAR
jgi:hypothetical protein